MGDDTPILYIYGYDTKVIVTHIYETYESETLFNLPLLGWAHDDTHEDIQLFLVNNISTQGT